MRARLLKSSNRFTAYSSCPIELKLSAMILDISPLNRSKPDFSNSFKGALWRRASCNIQINSQPTSSYPTELNHGRMILDINPHNRSASNVSPEGAPLEIFKSIHSLHFVSD